MLPPTGSRPILKAGPENEARDSHGRWVDTLQQKAVLRQSAVARKVRKLYPTGTRVEATSGPGGEGNGNFGVVERHIPHMNAQGGVLRVRWDRGHVSRISPGSVRRHDSSGA